VNITLSDFLTFLGLLFVCIGGAWTVTRTVSANLRARLSAAWKRIDESRKEIEQLKIDQAVLKQAIANIPDSTSFRSELRDIETKIDRRLEKLSEQVTQIAMTGLKNHQ
jgi:hypothetical protein